MQKVFSVIGGAMIFGVLRLAALAQDDGVGGTAIAWRMPAMIAVGVGGHPAMLWLTGIMLAMGPRVA